MQLKMWQVDAFANAPLEGNPAAIVPLEAFLAPSLMQKIANENNLAETAFIVPSAPGKYDLRWFTPEAEVDLCGHATLASAFLVFEKLAPELSTVEFSTRSGLLTVTRGKDGRNVMSLPADPPRPFDNPALAEQIGKGLNVTPPQALFSARYVMAVWDDPVLIRRLPGPGTIQPVLHAHGMWGLIVTAPGDGRYDFISRFFAPEKGVPEDPVTGSAHCILTPYWAQRLGKTTLDARQVSPRGGDLICTDDGARTVLSGGCSFYMEAQIYV